jgi:hypothetical protein
VQGESGRYSLTFTEAKKVCKERRGGEIASPEDMLEARSRGYEMCVWGWLSDGHIGLVMQSSESKCLNWFTDGLFMVWLMFI